MIRWPWDWSLGIMASKMSHGCVGSNRRVIDLLPENWSSRNVAPRVYDLPRKTVPEES